MLKIKVKRKDKGQEKIYIHHQHLQHQISRVMFLSPPTHLLQVKNQKKNIYSQRVIQKSFIALSNFQDMPPS